VELSTALLYFFDHFFSFIPIHTYFSKRVKLRVLQLNPKKHGIKKAEGKKMDQLLISF